jgi:hypothetical protein
MLPCLWEVVVQKGCEGKLLIVWRFWLSAKQMPCGIPQFVYKIVACKIHLLTSFIYVIIVCKHADDMLTFPTLSWYPISAL